MLLAAAFALPAFLVTNESFRPIDERIRLDAANREHRFAAPTGEPLYFEYGLIVRAADGSRPGVTIRLNGSRAAEIASDRLFATNGGKVLLPVELVRPGENVLDVAVQGPPAATFELGGRIQNYFGIAPDFPRVFVVADETVAHVNRRRSVALQAFRFAAFLLAGCGLTLGMAWISNRAHLGAGPLPLLVAPAVVPWIVLAYSFATRLHIWLSIEALAVATVAGAGLAVLVRGVGRHRALVIRFAAVTLVTLAIVEASLRLFHYVSPSFVFYSDPAGRYRGQPGAPHYGGSRLNSRGFNDIEHALSRPPTVTRRIVALGDSFALGSVPYAANYLTLLETEIAPDGSTEVINMGVSGTDPVDYLSMLVQEGLAFGPDLVLVNLFVGNDFENRARAPYEYSYVATLIHALWELSTSGVPGVAGAVRHATDYRDDEPGVALDRFLEIEVDRSWIYVNGSERLSAATAVVGEHLRAIRDTAVRAGAAVAVVVIPDEAQVNGALQAEVVRASGYSVDDMDFELPNRAIAAELATDGIAMLDLLPVFRTESTKARLYKPQDTHWNIAGNQLAARQIAAFVRQLERSNVKP